MTGGSQRRLPEDLRVLLVEDRFILARRIARMLHGLGCEPVGPVAGLAEGLDRAEREAGRLGAAVLDIDLRGEPVYPLADLLLRRRVAVVFATGYGASAQPESWRHVPRVQKPFDAAALERALAAAVADPARPPCVPLGRTRAVRPLPFEVKMAWEAIRISRNLLAEADELALGR